MPIATSDLPLSAPGMTVSVALEPAHNIQHSLTLLAQAEDVSGYDEWVYRTYAALSAEERDTNLLVMNGFYYATRPRASYPSFPAYIEHLATIPPTQLRDKVMATYLGMMPDEADRRLTTDEVLADINTFMAFLRRGFNRYIPEIERRAYTYLLDPPAMQGLIVGHLRAMWYKYLAVEWERVRPMLQKAVRAFDSVDLSSMDRAAAAEYVVGRPLRKDDKWCDELDDAERLVFVPSAHIGPYTAKMRGQDRTWILFGARQPQDAGEMAPELTRAELLVRLNALADDARLNILRLVVDTGEARSADIIQLLDMSQSAASRHLQQLTAAGFLHERRCNGAKCYHLNAARVDDTLLALASFLARTETRELVSPGRAKGE